MHLMAGKYSTTGMGPSTDKINWVVVDNYSSVLPQFRWLLQIEFTTYMVELINCICVATYFQWNVHRCKCPFGMFSCAYHDNIT